MADRRIESLIEASGFYAGDNLVIAQNRTTKRITKQTLVNSLADALRGRGGISYIELTSTDGLIDTYTIYYANTDAEPTTFQVMNGEKGDAGDNNFIHVAFATTEPVQDTDIHFYADNWLGVCTSRTETAPTSYAAYKWVKIKGEEGNTGAAASLEYYDVVYANSADGTIAPSGGWTETPQPVDGQYLWTRVTLTFNSGDPVVFYSVSRDVEGGGGSSGVTSVTVNGERGITSSGSPITGAGVITVGHTNNAPTATESAIRPIRWDAYGHITAAGAAVDPIPKPAATSGQYLAYNGTNWIGANPPASVTSVNGKTGAVTTATVEHIAVTLSASGWSSNEQTVEIGAYNAATTNFVISPDPASFDVYVAAVIRAHAFASPIMTFKATTTPTADVTVNVMIIKEG